jgi:hypothetical protein
VIIRVVIMLPMRSLHSMLWLLLAGAAAAQQPNSVYHRMTVNGVDGPPFPIVNATVLATGSAAFLIGGLPNQPYAIYQGPLATGTATAVGGIVDLALNPLPAKAVDGFSNPMFTTGPTGVGSLAVQVPPPGTPPTGIPIGFTTAVQCVVADPFNAPWGVALTAASNVTVAGGSNVTFYSLGNESSQPFSLNSMPIPYYGTSYTQAHICSNGYVTFATAIVDFSPTSTEMDTLAPRIAPMWTDLNCPPNAVKVTFDTNPGGGLPGYFKVEYLNVTAAFNPGVLHNFSLTLKADGNVELHSAVTNNPSVYDSITGIGPGNSLGLPQTQKNFIGPQPPGSAVGPGILTTPPYSFAGTPNMSFYEWFGLINGQHPYYGNSYNNPFDIFGVTIRFQPSGPGGSPANTLQYTVW